jgi:hypothetical protein
MSAGTLEAEIVNRGTGYELSITVDRTELSAQQQLVPIRLTTATGDSVPGLPSNFSLRVPAGAALYRHDSVAGWDVQSRRLWRGHSHRHSPC